MGKHQSSPKSASAAAKKRNHVINVTTLRKRLKQISDARDTLYFIGNELNAMKLEFEVFSVTVYNAFGSAFVPKTVPEYIKVLADDINRRSRPYEGNYMQVPRV